MKRGRIIVIEMAGDKLPSLMAAAARERNKKSLTAWSRLKLHIDRKTKLGLRKCEDWVNDEEFSSTSKITKMIKP